MEASCNSIYYKINQFFLRCSKIGILQAVFNLCVLKYYNFLEILGFKVKNTVLFFLHKNYSHPIALRYKTSDFIVFHQIFIEQQYALIGDLKECNLIIDCGANAGYATLFFLNKFPRANILAIEPEYSNFKICERNLSFYKKRVKCINSAVWSSRTGLVISRNPYGNGFDWAFQVNEAGSEEPDLYSVDIDSLIHEAGSNVIDLLKIDIEGAESEIFNTKYSKWLSKTKNLMIELHNESCKQIFFNALSSFQYNLATSGEITACKNITLK